MTARPTPEEIRRATFRVVFRGYDQAEVESYLSALASAVDDLAEERERLIGRLGEFADRDLRSEFETVGREVASVLEAARQAAQTMRDRAAADAARWRAEAVAESEKTIRSARSDAEALRTDAWTTGSQLLEQIQAEVVRMRDTVDREVLSIRGEAERESHRMTSSARRESEEALRTARMEAERLVGDARAEHDDIIATAHRQAESAQERTRALEERRRELMSELESVRATLSGFETELETRRQGIGSSEPGPTRVVVDESGEPRVEDWEDGRTVRIIRPQHDDAPSPSVETGPPTADELAEEVARLRSQPETPPSEPEAEPVSEEPEPGEHELEEPVPGEAGLEEVAAELDQVDAGDVGEEPPPLEALPIDPAADDPTGEPVAVESSVDADGDDAEEAEREIGEVSPGPSDDEISELFRSLRTPGDTAVDETFHETPSEEEAALEEPSAVAAAEHSDEGSDEEVGPAPAPSPQPVVNGHGSDPFELRERLLLPVTNAALRSVKRTLMDAQNEALDQIRVTDGTWSPDPTLFEEALLPDLARMVDEALEAGYEAASALGLGSHEPSAVSAPPDVGEVPGALSESLRSALSHAGGGQKERSAAASRIFRGWRTDEAERRIRFLALAAYHAGLKDSLDQEGAEWAWEPHGRLCPECRDVSSHHDQIPPVHRDCDCTIVPA